MFRLEFTLLNDTDRHVIHGKMESLLAAHAAMGDEIDNDWVIYDDEDRVFSQGESFDDQLVYAQAG